jgi:hypothetical protein
MFHLQILQADVCGTAACVICVRQAFPVPGLLPPGFHDRNPSDWGCPEYSGECDKEIRRCE